MFLGNLQVSRFRADRDSLRCGHIFPGGLPGGAPWQQLAFRIIKKHFVLRMSGLFVLRMSATIIHQTFENPCGPDIGSRSTFGPYRVSERARGAISEEVLPVSSYQTCRTHSTRKWYSQAPMVRRKRTTKRELSFCLDLNTFLCTRFRS